MIQNVSENNKISFLLSKTNTIDLEALNLLAGGTEQVFCCCNYCEYNGKHRLNYDVWLPNNMYLQKETFVLENFIHACLELFEVIDRYSLNLADIKTESKFIFKDDVKYRFIYIPVITKKKITKKKFIVKMFSDLKKVDTRLVGLIKEIKKMKSEDLVLDYFKEYTSGAVLKERTILDDSESETTILSEHKVDTECETTILSESKAESESETTVLSNNRVQETDTEGETTILSEHTTEFLTNESAECETTFLSEMPLREEFKNLDSDVECELFLLRVGTGEQIHINKSQYSIGKDIQTMDYVLGNQSVSRNHATIYIEDNKFYLTDNGSTNGTTIEGIRVQVGERAELSDGDIISLGNEVFQVLLERK